MNQKKIHKLYIYDNNFFKMKFIKTIPIFLTISSLTLLSIPSANANPVLARGAAKVGRTWLAPLVIGIFGGAFGENARAANNLCTRHVRRYNADRSVANARLNYYESQGWDTSALRNGIARRRDDFEHTGYKKGCTGLNGNLGRYVHGRTQADFYNY